MLERVGVASRRDGLVHQMREGATPDVALEPGAGDGGIRRVTCEEHRAGRGEDRRSRQQSARGVARAPEVLEEQGGSRGRRERFAELAGVEARRGDAGEIRRFFEQRAGARGMIRRSPERLQRRQRFAGGVSDVAGDGLDARAFFVAAGEHARSFDQGPRAVALALSHVREGSYLERSGGLGRRLEQGEGRRGVACVEGDARAGRRCASACRRGQRSRRELSVRRLDARGVAGAARALHRVHPSFVGVDALEHGARAAELPAKSERAAEREREGRLRRNMRHESFGGVDDVRRRRRAAQRERERDDAVRRPCRFRRELVGAGAGVNRRERQALRLDGLHAREQAFCELAVRLARGAGQRAAGLPTRAVSHRARPSTSSSPSSHLSSEAAPRRTATAESKLAVSRSHPPAIPDTVTRTSTPRAARETSGRRTARYARRTARRRRSRRAASLSASPSASRARRAAHCAEGRAAGIVESNGRTMASSSGASGFAARTESGSAAPATSLLAISASNKPSAQRSLARASPPRSPSKHSGGRVPDGASARNAVVGDRAEAEINQHRSRRRRTTDDEHVVRLHVAVGDAHRVQAVERVADVARHGEREPDAIVRFFQHARVERAPFDPFEGEIGEPGRGSAVASVRLRTKPAATSRATPGESAKASSSASPARSLRVFGSCPTFSATCAPLRRSRAR